MGTTRWIFAAVACAAACQRGGQVDEPVPVPAPTPAPADAGPAMQKPAPPAAPDAAALLEAFGKRTQARLAKDYPPPAAKPDATDATPPPSSGDLTAVGACTRPTEDARAAMQKTIEAYLHFEGVGLNFGCVQPSGTIVDVTYGPVDPHVKSIGEWAVLRVRGKQVTTLAAFSGTAMDYWSEWSDEVSLGTLALVDLDGDGIDDDVLAKDQHEGGSQAHYVTLSVWMSRTGKVTKLTTEPYSDQVDVAHQHYVAGQPLVLAVTDHHDEVPGKYPCVTPGAKLEPCQAGVDARAVDRAGEVAGWFVAGNHKYGPEETEVPDRNLLASLLDEMQAPADERPALLAAMPPTSTELHVASEIAAAVATDKVVFGEHVALPKPPDTRAADLARVLGDKPCAAASGDALSQISAWIAKHDAQALLDHGDCHAGEKCTFRRPTAPVITASCGASGRGYYAAAWTYSDGANAVMRSAVFYVDAHGAKLLTSGTSTGMANPCNACGPGPENVLDARFHQHGAALVALVITRGDAQAQKAIESADGVTAPMAATDSAQAKWFRFAEPDDDYRVKDAGDVVEITDGSADALWRWDGAWSVIVDQNAGLPPTPSPAQTWIEDAQSLTSSWRELRSFSPWDWGHDADKRKITLDELAIIHADPALIARIKAAGDSLPPPEPTK